MFTTKYNKAGFIIFQKKRIVCCFTNKYGYSSLHVRLIAESYVRQLELIRKPVPVITTTHWVETPLVLV